MLTAALMELEAMRLDLKPPAADATAHVVQTLQQTLETTRSLTVQLSPPVLRELGLLPALRWLAREVLQPRGIEVQFEFHDPQVKLEDETALILFQSVREIFANVIKHSHATNVVIRTSRQDGRLHICVEDNGVGFDSVRWVVQPDLGNHFGLFNIREQLRAVGGILEFESEPKRFTRAQVSIPL
jgi:signal transduction histidine kinase